MDFCRESDLSFYQFALVYNGLSSLDELSEEINKKLTSVENKISLAEGNLGSKMDGVKKDIQSKINSKIDGVRRQIDSKMNRILDYMGTIKGSSNDRNNFLDDSWNIDDDFDF